MNPPNGLRYPLGVGAWILPRNGIPPKPEKCSKNAGPTPSRVHAVLGGGCRLLPTIRSHRQRTPNGLPSGHGATLRLVLAVFFVGFPLHLFETGVVIGKLVEMSESDFAGDDRIVARHVC